MPGRRRSTHAGLLVLAPVVSLVLALAGCSGDAQGGGGEDAADPAEVLAQAKGTLDETSGLSLSLETTELPEGTVGVLNAEGVATHAPAFDGTIMVPLVGNVFEVPIISVDSTVYAKIPLTPGWSEVDPAEYGAPDPAQLLDPDTGFSALLTATEDVEAGDSVRGGEGNREVLTEYTGTVPGDVVTGVIPSAEGTFEARYTVTDEGELRAAELTGVFYPDTEPITYTLGFDDYGSEPEISAP